ncbi:SID1 transmembrane family member 1 isoform 2 [Schistosoma japonicum]|uniref:SID1 transmembrane family member 1 isoform 2 n=1 Tax=Schistosoma japonicum TaxID=6182 RepID=A0A4Z2CYZ2_SCHJA|nr:SID1 transmembrane family member 1 isoform 2 [Schistosoma japonicum]
MVFVLFGTKFTVACLIFKIYSVICEADLDKPYYGEVSQDQKTEYQFSLSSRSEYVIRVHVVNYNPKSAYPILVVIKQVDNVMSFQVPMVLNSISVYGNVSRTLCPIKLLPGEVRNLTVELSSAVEPSKRVRYLFLAQLVRDFDLESGVERNMLVSPAEPVYLRYLYPPGKNSAEIKVISKSDICMVLSIQKLQCPVNDLSDTVGNTGLHQTVTTLGAISIDVTQVFKGFFIVLVLKPTDYACSGIENIIPPLPDGGPLSLEPRVNLPGSRIKSVKILVTSAPRRWPYLLPILGAVGIYLLFYVVTIILILLYHRAERRKNFHDELMANFECGSDYPTVYSDNLRDSNVYHVNNTTISSTIPIQTATCSTSTSRSAGSQITTNLVNRRDRYNYGSLISSTSHHTKLHHHSVKSNSLQTQMIPVESVSYDNPVIYNPTKVSLESLKKMKSAKDKKKSALASNSNIHQTSSDSLNVLRPSHTDTHHHILSLPQDYQSISLSNSLESNLHFRASIHQTPLVEIHGSHGWFSSTDDEDDYREDGCVCGTNNKMESRKKNRYFTGLNISTTSVDTNTTTGIILDNKQLPTNSAYSTMIGQETSHTPKRSVDLHPSNATNNANNSNDKHRNDKSDNVSSVSLTDEQTDINSKFIPMYKMNVLLYVSDLSRKRYGTLNRKYLLYFWYLIIISIFYGLPAVQLIMTYQKAVFETGNEDLCYYNFECAHSLGIFTAFNNIISNIGYVMLGLLFLGLTARRDILHRRTKNVNPNSQVLGIPQHYGLFYAMGLALTMEGLMSACYHMCPNFSNFQFDTAYMYILAMLIMLKIYQTRHPDVNASAHSAYMVMAVVIFLGVLGVLYGNQIFWIIFTIFFLIMSVVLTVEIYYMGQWNIDLCLPRRIYHLIRTDGIGCFRPTYLERMLLLLIANLVNFTLAGYGIVKRPRDFSTFLLSIFMINLLMYTFFYVIMKLRHRERFQMLSLVYILLACVSWGCAIYFYLTRTTTWEVTPAKSRALNQPCVLLDFYDAHDVWHFLSSVSMFFSFMLLMYLDDDLSKRPRNQIFVF